MRYNVQNNKIHLFFLFYLLYFQLIDTEAVNFTDVTEKVGIKFRHQNGYSEDHFIPETLGAGIAVFDYDNDGWIDLYFVNSGYIKEPYKNRPNSLYKNLGDGTFGNVTDISGVGDTGFGIGVTVGDYDNDGHPDLYVTNMGPNVLYRNNGDSTFTDTTRLAGVGYEGCSTGCAFFDFDRDGDLDLYVANYVPIEEINQITNKDGYKNPIFYQGARDVLYQNEGNGTFSEVDSSKFTDSKEKMRLFKDARGLGVVATDFDRDWWTDVYIANDKSKNLYFQHNGFEDINLPIFTESATTVGIGYDGFGEALAGMGIAVGDYNNDCNLDIFVTNFAYEYNNLYRCDPDGTGKLFYFDDTTTARLGDPSFPYVGWGTTFFDYDNDGDLDLFIANGHIMKDAELNSNQLTYAQPDQLFENQLIESETAYFVDISQKSGSYFSQRRVGRGAVHLDYDNDGDLDLLISNSGQSPILLRNNGGNQRNWVSVTLVGQAIGVKLKIQSGDQTQIRQVDSSASYCSVNDLRIHFGVGSDKIIDQLEIWWDEDCYQKLTDVEARQHLVISRELTGIKN